MENNDYFQILLIILLGVVGYFLRDLHTAVKKMGNAIVDLTTRLVVSEEKVKGGDMLLSQRIKVLEEKVKKIESRA